LPRCTTSSPADEIAALLRRLAWRKGAMRPNQLSGGQRQRLALLPVVNDPRLVLLDEPTTGLDPQARHGVWSLIRQLRGEGRTVVLTTHAMEEAQELCDRVHYRARPADRAWHAPGAYSPVCAAAAGAGRARAASRISKTCFGADRAWVERRCR
jgi:ABC-type Mn2+/Zn2+ transport system ATPase subunit